MSTTKQRLSADVARAARYGKPDQEATARRQLAEATIADAIKKALAAAPPLNQTQINRLSGLLRGGAK